MASHAIASGFVFPCDGDGDGHDDGHYSAAGFLSDANEDGEDAQDVAANELDREAQALAARVLLVVGLSSTPRVKDFSLIPQDSRLTALARRLDRLAIRSSRPFMAAVVGHLPYTIVQRLVTLVFFPDRRETETVDSAGFVEHLLFLLATALPAPACDALPNLRECLMNADALHQSLLRTTKAAVSEFSSPHAQTAETLPAFPVFGQTGNAQDAFRRRPLETREAKHPYLPESSGAETDTTPRRRRQRAARNFAADTNACPGHRSVVATLEMFQRAFRVFTLGLVDDAGLARDRAVVAGGAVAACLHPWPPRLRRLWLREKRSIHLLRSGFRGRLPPEIVQAVDRLAAWTDSQTVELDRALFEHLCRSESPYGSSDIDVFFVCPEGAMDVSAACRTLPKVQAAVVRNRQAVDVRKFLDSEEHENHWVFSDLDHRYDWFTETISGERRYSSRYSWHGGSPEYQRDERGWSPIMLERLRARLRLLWTVRTTNSVTVTGVHPVRHTQLMLPVVRSAEQVIHTFDLDCVCVFYDGSQVYASPRSLRAFNTRTNFVDLRSIQDKPRALRMVKYRDRGFATAVFDICRHDPRCDVRATASIRSIIQRAFPEKLVNRSHGPNVRTDAFPVPLDPDDNPGLGPPLKHLRLIGMDYVPAPLVYGEIIGASELCEQIKILESGRYEFDVERNDIRKFTPVLRRLPYAITSDPIKFSNCLMDPQGKLIAMQFKFVKDGWLDRRLYVATALQFCYMCKKGVEAGLQAERNTHEPQSPRHDDELDEDEEYWDDSPSEWDDGSEADSSPESAQHPAARTSVSPGDEYDSFSEQSIVERHPRLPTPAPRQIPLCPTCAAINAQKRAETTELRGATAVVVGGQRKVGRCVVLRLLRMGATVHATTQLPRLLLAALRKEPDAEAWWDRVRVHQLDLTDAGAVVRLAQWMASSLPRLDMLVQLAAQKAVRQGARRWQRLAHADAEAAGTVDAEFVRPWVRTEVGVEMQDSAEVVRGLGDLLREATVATKLGSPESDAVVAVAASVLAPAIFLQKLRPLLAASARNPRSPTHRVPASFVVTVLPRPAAAESRPSADCGCCVGLDAVCVSGGVGGGGDGTPSNYAAMAAAALGRLTQTVAGPLAAEGIYLSAVDAGWVSGPPPVAVPVLGKPKWGAAKATKVLPPLTAEDGAARVVDPVVRGVNEGVLFSGVLLRNFEEAAW